MNSIIWWTLNHINMELSRCSFQLSFILCNMQSANDASICLECWIYVNNLQYCNINGGWYVGMLPFWICIIQKNCSLKYLWSSNHFFIRQRCSNSNDLSYALFKICFHQTCFCLVLQWPMLIYMDVSNYLNINQGTEFSIFIIIAFFV